MKKNRTLRIAVLMLALSLLTCCFVGSTFAKYTSSAAGSSTATVAKWDITVNGDKMTAMTDGADDDLTPDLTFNLFSTINDTGNTTDETDVADGKIAPGTAGSFDLKVKNLSEVTAKYTITLTEANTSNVPLQYSLDGTTWKDSVAELTVTGLTDQTLAVGAEEVTHTVYWRWVFEGTTEGAHAGQTDATDTALGVDAQTTAPTVTITASIVVNQVD